MINFGFFFYRKLQQAASVDANGNDQDAQFGNKDHDEEVSGQA